jgi:hypothetical protein
MDELLMRLPQILLLLPYFEKPRRDFRSVIG